jgi:hypothetical protein
MTALKKPSLRRIMSFLAAFLFVHASWGSDSASASEGLSELAKSPDPFSQGVWKISSTPATTPESNNPSSKPHDPAQEFNPVAPYPAPPSQREIATSTSNLGVHAVTLPRSSSSDFDDCDPNSVPEVAMGQWQDVSREVPAETEQFRAQNLLSPDVEYGPNQSMGSDPSGASFCAPPPRTPMEMPPFIRMALRPWSTGDTLEVRHKQDQQRKDLEKMLRRAEGNTSTTH